MKLDFDTIDCRNFDRFDNVPGNMVCTFLHENPVAKFMSNEEQNAIVVFAQWICSKVKVPQ